MATKKCPYCAEEIQEEAVKCRHCGSWLSTPPGQPVEEAPVQNVMPAESGRPPKRLLRSSSDRMLAGVCGGLGKYLDMDPTLVRILFAVVTFFTGIIPGILTYIVLAFVVPTDDRA